ncbi:protein BatD [Bacteroides sp. OF04-15BH]|nr:protein BatD [Bacteroides sp. OF04-15BH]
MIRKQILFFILLFSVIGLNAQVRFTTSAPEAVVEGEQFRLSFKVNTQDVSDFKAPAFNGFDVLMGPSRSVESSFSMVNGKTTQSSSITFTYILSATKPGNYTIPGATLRSDGQVYKSNSVRLRVLKADASASRSQSSGGATRMHTQQSGSQITGKDLFITVTANKKRVFEQEAILLTYKVYSLVNLTQLAGNMPDLDGFHTQEIPLPQQKSMTMEHFNGRNYGTVVWRQYLLFPQRAGKLKVPAVEFEGLVVQQNNAIDPIDAFFNGADLTTEVKKKIVAPGMEIQVDPLPTRPANFSGAVGKFNIESALIPEQDLKSNDALTLKLTVSGTGNMKLLTAPKVNFPKDFETYDPKVTDNTRLERGGATGNKVFEYIAVPRYKGDYEIPAVEFCYFDPDAKSYKTIKTQPYKIKVAQGISRPASDAAAQKELELLNSDIRYIKSGAADLQPVDDLFFGSASYWTCLAVLFVLLVAVSLYLRVRGQNRQNVARMKGKRANSVAVKRLKAAHKLLEKQQADSFYEEVLKALWGYVSDKLTIPVAELNKENIQQRLVEHNVDTVLAGRFNDVLNDCEFARFAPGDPQATMDKIYQDAETVISELENVIKK